MHSADIRSRKFKRVADMLMAVSVALLSFIQMSCVGAGSQKSGTDSTYSDSIARAYNDIGGELRMRADSAALRMDTLELIAQLIMPAVYASDDYWTVEQVLEYGRRGIGGIVLLKGDSQGARTLADTMKSVSKIQPFVSIDAEWGLNMRLADAPKFPANGRISPEASDQLMYDYGREVARECRLLGINMVLGPVLDVADGNGFLGFRSFGDNPERVSELGLAYGRGLEDGNVISVAKHFPGHGGVATDSHKDKGVISGSLQRLDTVDLVPFRRWIDEGLSGVMVGHLAVPSIDSKMLPAAVSPTVIGDLLRGDLGFKGLVITDAMNMLGAEGYGADMAIIAGADIVVAPKNTEVDMLRIKDALAEGRLSMEDLRDRVSRILFYKYLLVDDSGMELRNKGMDRMRDDSIAGAISVKLSGEGK